MVASGTQLDYLLYGIEIASQADERGEYSLKLSFKRDKSTIKYITHDVPEHWQLGGHYSITPPQFIAAGARQTEIDDFLEPEDTVDP